MQIAEEKPTKLKSPKATTPDYLGANPRDRVHVFIDAMNMMGMLRQANKRLDFTGFLDFLNQQTRLVRCSYYVLLREGIGESAEKTIDMMEYAGYDVNRKWVEEFQDRGGHYETRATIVPELTVGILDAIENGDIQHIMLLTGDAEMHAAVMAAKARGIRVTLLGMQGAVADVLKRECDHFVDIIADLPETLFLR